MSEPNPDPMVMIDKWFAYHEIYRLQFNNRKTIEWKLALALWGAILAITWGLLTIDTLGISASVLVGCLSAAFLLIFLVSFYCWMLPMQHSHARDVAYMRYCRRQIELYLLTETPLQTPLHPLPAHDGPIGLFCSFKIMGRSRKRWLIGQAAMTAILMLTSLTVVWCRFSVRESTIPASHSTAATQGK